MRLDRDLHRLLLLGARRQASHEEEDFADGPARRLHLLPEPIEVPPKLGDPLVVLVLARPSFPESLLELAELRSIRVSARLVGPSSGVGGLSSRGFGSFGLGGLLLRRCLPSREGLLETVEAVSPPSLAPVQDRFEVAEPVILGPPRRTHREEHQRGSRGDREGSGPAVSWTPGVRVRSAGCRSGEAG